MTEKALSQEGLNLIEKMIKAGIVDIKVSFSGSGDSGDIDDVEFTDSNGELIESVDIDYNNDIESLFSDITNEYIRGWENNDGASGVIDFSITKEGAFEINSEVMGYQEEISDIDVTECSFDPELTKGFFKDDETKRFIKCCYSGSGDSGDIDSIEIVKLKGDLLSDELIQDDDCVDSHSSVKDFEFQEKCYSIIRDNIGSFEIDGGGVGSLYIDMDSGKAIIKHQCFYESSFDYLSGILLKTDDGLFQYPESSDIKIDV